MNSPWNTLSHFSDSGIVIFTHYKYEKAVKSVDQDEVSDQHEQGILLPPYSAVATDDLRPYDDRAVRDEGYSEARLNDALGRYKDASPRVSTMFWGSVQY